MKGRKKRRAHACAGAGARSARSRSRRWSRRGAAAQPVVQRVPRAGSVSRSSQRAARGDALGGASRRRVPARRRRRGSCRRAPPRASPGSAPSRSARSRRRARAGAPRAHAASPAGAGRGRSARAPKTLSGRSSRARGACRRCGAPRRLRRRLGRGLAPPAAPRRPATSRSRARGRRARGSRRPRRAMSLRRHAAALRDHLQEDARAHRRRRGAAPCRFPARESCRRSRASFGLSRRRGAGCTRTRASATSSSSAAICASAVRMPWPSSTLPGVMVTCALRVEGAASASSRRLTCRLPGSFGLPSPRGRLERRGSCRASPSAAARSTARMIRLWLPQRQRCGSSAARIAPRPGRGSRASSAAAATRMPDRQ